MPESKKRPKPVEIEHEIKTFNPTKSIIGKILIIVIAVGFIAGILVAAVYQMILVLK